MVQHVVLRFVQWSLLLALIAWNFHTWSLCSEMELRRGVPGLAVAPSATYGEDVDQTAVMATVAATMTVTVTVTAMSPSRYLAHVRREAVTPNARILEAMPLMQRSLCRLRQAASRQHRLESFYFIGDSTFRNQFEALCLAMRVGIRGYSIWTGTVDLDVPGCSGNLSQVQVFAAYFWSPGFLPEGPSILQEALMPLGHPPPTAIFFGAGLWYQWPAAGSDLDGTQPGAWPYYKPWRNYEYDVDRILDIYAETSPRQVISTPHAQCEQQFRGIWAQTVEQVRQEPSEGLLPCVEWLQTKMRVAEKRATDACSSGLRSRRGSMLLSERLKAALKGRETLDNMPPDFLVDAFALTDGRCDENLPGDTMHFHVLLYDELMLSLQAAGWQTEGPEAEECL